MQFLAPARRRAAALALFALSSATAFTGPPHAVAAEEVNVYSYREPQLVEPMLRAFTEATGIATMPCGVTGAIGW